MHLDSALEIQIEVMRSLFNYTELPDTSVASSGVNKPLSIPLMVDPRALEAAERNLDYHSDYVSIAFGVGTKGTVGRSEGGVDELLVFCQDRRLIRSQIVDKIVAKAPREVRVIYTGRARQQATAPLSGDSIGHERVTAGTLGCFVKHKKTGEIGLLSNNHVLAAVNRAQLGDPILHPGRIDGGTTPIAHLADFIPLDIGANSLNYSDAAWAKACDELREYLRNTIYDGEIVTGTLSPNVASVTLPGQIVEKVGRTTRRTSGVIQAIGVNHLWVVMESRGTRSQARFDNQIVIEGAGDGAFSKPGDSGSVIFDDKLNPLGLLFAGTEKGGANSRGLSYASPIKIALDGMDLGILEQ